MKSMISVMVILAILFSLFSYTAFFVHAEEAEGAEEEVMLQAAEETVEEEPAEPEPEPQPEPEPEQEETGEPESELMEEITEEPQEQQPEEARDPAEESEDTEKAEEPADVQESSETEETEEPDAKEEEPAEKSDDSADVESSETWTASFASAELTGDWSHDIIAIAHTQMGYRESTRNFIMENGHKYGYTRFGAWYGVPYGDWCAMFASFCIYYAGVPSDMFPLHANCTRWVENLASRGLFHASEGRHEGDSPLYMPRPGDIIFYDRHGEGESDHVGIVASVDFKARRITAIEGNAGNAVTTISYDLSDYRILGYGAMPSNPNNANPKFHEQVETDDYIVDVYAPAGVIPSNVRSEIKLEWYDEYNDTVWENAKNTVRTATTVQCVFTDENGNEFVPEEPVQIVISAKNVRNSDHGFVMQTKDGELKELECEYVDGKSERSIIVNANAAEPVVFAWEMSKEIAFMNRNGIKTVLTAFDEDAGIAANEKIVVGLMSAKEQGVFTDRAEKKNSVEGEKDIRILKIEAVSQGKPAEAKTPFFVTCFWDIPISQTTKAEIIRVDKESEPIPAIIHNGMITFKTSEFGVYAVVISREAVQEQQELTEVEMSVSPLDIQQSCMEIYTQLLKDYFREANDMGLIREKN